jgi:hypothetical protein
MLETPKGPGLDARESAVGTEQLLAEMEAKHNANSAKTPIQEAMASRGDAIQALARAKENLGAVATEQPVHSEASRVEIGRGRPEAAPVRSCEPVGFTSPTIRLQALPPPGDPPAVDHPPPEAHAGFFGRRGLSGTGVLLPRPNF